MVDSLLLNRYMADNLAHRLTELEQEKDDWMQKYFSLLTQRESEDLQVQEDLAVLEEEVNKLTLQTTALVTEKEELRTTVEELRTENSNLERELRTQQSRWEEDMAALRRALAKEREACAKELEGIGAQFQTVKGQFQELKAQTSGKALPHKLKRPASLRSLSSCKLKSIPDARDSAGKRSMRRPDKAN